MSSQSKHKLAKTKDGIAVYGYIRENFDKKCWIDEVMATIIQFYKIKGGSLYVCGQGQYGRLGIEKYKNKKCKIATLCPPFVDDNAYKVSVLTNHTLILDTDGAVWCCGSGTYGRLGNGTEHNLYVPAKLSLGIRVIDISAGFYHSLFLCADGTVKGCGGNQCGQIDLRDLQRTLVPKTIEKLTKYRIVQICAGEYFSAVCTEDGVLFCFGDNEDGQCGVGKDKGDCIMSPKKVDLDDEIEFVECGFSHTLVISRKGLIYSFGNGEDGGLGHGDEDDQYTPKLVDSLKEKRIKMCAAGSYHSLCIDEEGIVWSFGDNYHGQCGLSVDTTEQKTPKMIPWFMKNNIKAEKCFAGNRQSSIIATNGSLYLFGRNEQYQLGLQCNTSYYTPTKLSISQNVTVQSVSMGESHTAIICESKC